MYISDLYYHLFNATTNELVFAKWTRCPCMQQIASIRKTFGWASDNEIYMIGRRRRFKLIGNRSLLSDGSIGFSRIIQDRSYYITFNPDNDIEQILVVDSHKLLEDLIK